LEPKDVVQPAFWFAVRADQKRHPIGCLRQAGGQQSAGDALAHTAYIRFSAFPDARFLLVDKAKRPMDDFATTGQME
jgi:hypothetical protein